MRLAVFVLLAAAMFSRRPEAFMNPQFRAEDGTIFFLEARQLGSKALFEQYVGHFHLYQRIIALVGDLFPIQLVPAIYLTGSVVAFIFVSFFCLSERLPLLLGERVGLALAVTMAPTENEVFHTLTNTQWVLALILVLLVLVDKPATRAQWVFDILALIIVGLTGPFSLLFSPLFAVNWLRRRSPHSLVLFVGVVFCAALQLKNLILARTSGEFELWNLDFIRVANGFIGHTFAGSFARPPPEGTIATLLIGVAMLLLYGFLVADAITSRRFQALYFLAAGIIVLGSTLFAFKTNPGILKWGGNRYFFIPTVTLIWTLLLARRTHPRLAILALAISFLAFLESHRSEPLIDYHWQESSKCIGSGHPCHIPINPPGWMIEVD